MTEQADEPTEHEQEPAAPEDGSRPARRAAWWRLGAGVVAVGALTWGSLQAGAWGPGGSGDGAGSSADAGTGAGPAVGGTVEGDPVLVEEAALGCAGVDGLQGEVVAALPPAELGTPAPADDGARLVGVPAEEQDTDPTSLGSGSPSAGLALDGASAALLTGTGAAAPGLVAGRVTGGTEPGARGAALTACTTAAESHWLLAGDADPGRTEQLVLINPGSDPVQVDLDVRGSGGAEQTVGGSDLVVPPGEQLVRPVDALVAGVESPAVGVRAEGGPVIAQLTDTERDGTTDLGLDVTTPSAEPARDLVVPALPTQVEDQELVLRVLAPDQAAVVEIGALTEDGSATPGTSAVRVAAGASVDVPLDQLPEGVVGLRLRSDEPVTAALQIRLAPSGDEPVEQDEATSTADDEATSTADDEATSTADDDATTTAAPSGTDRPLVRPAGDLAWLPATPMRLEPVGIGVPAGLAAVPDGELELSVAVLDAASVEVLMLTDTGETTVESLDLANDSTALLPVPPQARALWVRPADAGTTGVAAALHLTGRDTLGPYRAASTLGPVPWSREVTGITRIVP
ncbi:DUF5719 family protein [Serinicoccus kebangsaanensis]|uniref:DUF5719 family protein n=1 Tax=Serinicoccus kebangsaanensis TaxID=2602069 RepID=UPI00124CC0F9|nr:DUF5719 family protein [Serinicoccus kebangsaanensis]